VKQIHSIPWLVRLYIAAVILSGIGGVFYTYYRWSPSLEAQFVLYLFIAIASSGMKVRIPGVKGTISVNYVFTILTLLEFRVQEALLLALVSALVQTFWHTSENPKRVQVLFNLSTIALTVLAAAFVNYRPWFGDSAAGQFIRLILAGVTYFTVNIFLVSIVVAITGGRKVSEVWKELCNWTFAYYLVGVSLAEMFHLSIGNLGWIFLVAVLPILYIIYRSYHLYLGRVEQQKVHAEEMAALHLRTIEALATAIEAKDECTGEHLRRVQVYSVSIGEKLGLDSRDLEALRAAAILHDIGKLAVPDYIISKPGKLTTEEFEKMKIHTIVGAAILEEVGFPYAVAPIVRAHHEKWDGTGYPNGLKGEAIPIGARILSAVDCLDALASDRQYRRALPIEEAMSYVASLSGRHFDPRVIDVLSKHFADFQKLTDEAPIRESRIDKQPVVSHGEGPDAGYQRDQSETGLQSQSAKLFVTSIASARQEMQTILELTHDLSGALRLEDTLAMVEQRLKGLMPFDCIAVYVNEDGSLIPKYVSGEGSRLFASLKIPLGHGLSGWVVENRKPIINGNPSVEPGYLNDPGKFSLLNSALAVPMTGDQMIGALTLYKSEHDAYTKDHLRVLLAISGKLSRVVETALRFKAVQEQAATDSLTGLPNASALYTRMHEELVKCEARKEGLAVLVCDLDGFKNVNDSRGHITGNELLKQVAAILQSNCRGSDYVARMGGDEFVMLLSGATGEEIEPRISQLDRLIRRASEECCGEEMVGMSVGVACFPDHGADAESLLANADDDMYRAKRARKADATNLVKLSRPTIQVA
jgi:diguanylate cyclase (GGDEF)-like protein/putative nucleotidyltransferase with HDIG domain